MAYRALTRLCQHSRHLRQRTVAVSLEWRVSFVLLCIGSYYCYIAGAICHSSIDCRDAVCIRYVESKIVDGMVETYLLLSNLLHIHQPVFWVQARHVQDSMDQGKAAVKCQRRAPSFPEWQTCPSSCFVSCMPLICRLLSSSQPSALHSQCAILHRGIQTSAMLAGDVKIEVPSMGDSISEGTVASVAKQAGEHHSLCLYGCNSPSD